MVALLALLALAIVAIALNVVTGASAERIRNPAPHATHVFDGVPRANAPFLGVAHWPEIFEAATLIAAALFWTAFIRLSRRRGRWHPGLVLMVALTALTWLDPVMNWAPYASYDPRLLHFPVTWPWASLSPTVEPLVVLLGYPYFYLIPALLALWLHRRLAARAGRGGFVNRHPLLSLAALGYVIGVVWDAPFEMFLTRIELYSYTQVIGSLSVRAGTTWQFPLVWESGLIAGMMALTATMLWQDDSGRTINDRLATRWRTLQRRPRLAPVAVATALLSVAYLGYGAGFAALRLTHAAKTVARPWPYQETKVYDPHGDYRKTGEPGPYFRGIWANAAR